jgi:hypothetical protein
MLKRAKKGPGGVGLSEGRAGWTKGFWAEGGEGRFEEQGDRRESSCTYLSVCLALLGRSWTFLALRMHLARESIWIAKSSICSPEGKT